MNWLEAKPPLCAPTRQTIKIRGEGILLRVGDLRVADIDQQPAAHARADLKDLTMEAIIAKHVVANAQVKIAEDIHRAVCIKVHHKRFGPLPAKLSHHAGVFIARECYAAFTTGAASAGSTTTGVGAIVIAAGGFAGRLGTAGSAGEGDDQDEEKEVFHGSFAL